MKIYKLDIDTSKPTNQVVAVHQNSVSALKIDVANDGKYIRDLNCAVYDGDTEIKPSISEDNSFTYKVEVGETPKKVKVIAQSVPYDSTREYIESITAGNKPKAYTLNLVQIKEGVYNQDEFESLAQLGELYGYGAKTGLSMNTYVLGSGESHANFFYIEIRAYHPTKKVLFLTRQGEPLPYDAKIVVDADVDVGYNGYTKASAIVKGTATYPSVGYYTDYSKEVTITPTMDALYWGEYDVPDPIDSSDSELNSTDSELDPTDSGLIG